MRYNRFKFIRFDRSIITFLVESEFCHTANHTWYFILI